MLKKVFSTGTIDWKLDLGILIIRIAIGAFMLTHGYPKLMRLFSGEEIRFADPFGFGPVPSLALAVFAEFFCSIFIAIGLGTRLAAVPLIITMSVAAFIAHAGDPFGRKETALLYLLVYVLLLITGSRRYSLDRLLFGK